jgi:phosphatidate cytidylyltransferase
MSLSSLKTRTITAIFFVAVLVSATLIHSYVFAIVFGIIAFLSTLEFVKMLNKKNGFSISTWLSGALSIFLFLLVSMATFEFISPKFIVLVLLFLPIYMIFEMYQKTENTITNVLGGFFSVIYASLPYALLVNIHTMNMGDNSASYFVLIYFFIIWIHDSGAYLVGSKFGKRRLFERISPKKSWEGLIGGLVFSVIFAILIHNYFSFMSLPAWILLTLLVITTANFGDLTESMLKRNVGIKDSGNILPGHGGLLDRFDAVLLSTPFVFVYLQLI